MFAHSTMSEKKYNDSIRKSPTFPNFLNNNSSEMSNKTMELTLNSIPEDKEDTLINGKYIKMTELGQGSFGTVYKAKDLQNNLYAIKMEHRSDLKKHLLREKKVYEILKKSENFPTTYWYGEHGLYRCLVMDMMGTSLKELFNTYKFGLSTISRIAVELLKRLCELHEYGILHQDIKPENILTGYHNTSKLFLVDYGTCDYWLDLEKNRPYSSGTSNKIVGTARYSSLTNHRGQKQSRRDDLFSLGYVLVYLAKRRLPWQGIKTSTRDYREKWRKVKNVKCTVTYAELCYNLPSCFFDYFQHVGTLGFYDKPDYIKLMKLFIPHIKKPFPWDEKNLP